MAVETAGDVAAVGVAARGGPAEEVLLVVAGRRSRGSGDRAWVILKHVFLRHFGRLSAGTCLIVVFGCLVSCSVGEIAGRSCSSGLVLCASLTLWPGFHMNLYLSDGGRFVKVVQRKL